MLQIQHGMITASTLDHSHVFGIWLGNLKLVCPIVVPTSISHDWSTMDETSCNVVAIYGDYSSTCGYCQGGSRSSASFGMDAERLTVQDYQYLIDRGWRRSGTYLYRPNNFKTCCTLYTHRLDVNKFKINKEQKKALKKFEAFLGGEESRDHALVPSNKKQKPCDGPLGASESCAAASIAAPNVDDVEAKCTILKGALERAFLEIKELGMINSLGKVPSVSVQPAKRKAAIPGGVSHTSAWPHALAALLRKNGGTPTARPAAQGPKTQSAQVVADLLCKQMEANGVRATALNGHINFLDSPAPTSGQHGDRPQESSLKGINDRNPAAVSSRVESVEDAERPNGPHSSSRHQFTPPRQPTSNEGLDASGHSRHHTRRRDFEVKTVRSSPDLVDLEFPLYKKYQMSQHGDPSWKVTPSGFRRFLIDTPLQSSGCQRDGDHPGAELGSFHQQYWLDGVLIAVGVVDILPYCLSSKYFFWDPDFAFLSLGRISALKEIEWVQKAQQFRPQLKYYYMGYYIHSCHKMRYKIKFEPADLLCPRHLRWVPFSLAEARINSGHGVELIAHPAELEDLGDDYKPHTSISASRKGSSAEQLAECKDMKIALNLGGHDRILPLETLLASLAHPQRFLAHSLPLLLEAKAHLGGVTENTAVSF